MKLNLVSEKVGRITSLEELFEASDINPKHREVLKHKVNKREVAMNKKDWTTELTELLGCSYKKYFDFRLNVLDMLERDINKNTDMQIRYFPEKIGRKVGYINFEFSIN